MPWQAGLPAGQQPYGDIVQHHGRGIEATAHNLPPMQVQVPDSLVFLRLK